MGKSVKDLFDLTGKTAVVTGGASLLGAKITEALLEAGARVWITTSRNDPEEVKENLQLDCGKENLDVVCFQMKDPDRRVQLVKIREQILSQTGKIDILVSNAVIRTNADASDEEIEEQIAANAMGLISTVEVFGSQMCRQNSGSIIIMSSNSASVAPDPSNYEGTQVPGYLPGYNISKASCSSFMRFSASKYGKYGVRCNAISPLAVHSPTTPERFEKNYARRTMLGRICYPEDIKGLIVYLASDASAYVTGVDIPLDGGHAAM